MSDTRPFILGLLPEEFLLRQGIYVQTCAHLEAVLWRIFKHTGGIDLEDPKQLSEAMGARKRNPKLLEKLRETIDTLDDGHRGELTKILNQIESELFARHMAVHGAWLKSGDAFRCEYYEKKGDEWHQHDYDISLEEIDAAIQTVNAMLLSASQILMELKSGR